MFNLINSLTSILLKLTHAFANLYVSTVVTFLKPIIYIYTYMKTFLLHFYTYIYNNQFS